MMRRLNQAGFTLIELTVTMVLISVVGLMVSNFIVQWLQASSLTQARTALLSNAETALDTIGNDIRLSGSTDLTNRWADPNGPGNNQYGWQSGSQTIVLARASVDKSNNIIFSDPAKYIPQKDDVIYYLSGTTLYRRIISAGSANDAAVTTCPAALATSTCPADSVIATNVSSFTATYYDAGENQVTPDNARSVNLDITLTQQQDAKTLTASYNTRMVFRNE